ncbi:MAG: hypothetical protein ACR9NN_16815 [Nostochopsis sp.]
MENIELNAKTKKILGRDSQSNGENDRQGLGKLRASSPINGTGEQNRFISGDCEENNSGGYTDFQREGIDTGSNVGKILEEVLLLKQQFLDYVKSDQSRLEARLDESKKQEQQFLVNAEALEKRLKTALAIQQQVKQELDIEDL